MSHTVIWNEGYQARKNGASRESNPHIGAYAAEWYAGWDAADAIAKPFTKFLSSVRVRDIE